MGSTSGFIPEAVLNINSRCISFCLQLLQCWWEWIMPVTIEFCCIPCWWRSHLSHFPHDVDGCGKGAFYINHEANDVHGRSVAPLFAICFCFLERSTTVLFKTLSWDDTSFWNSLNSFNSAPKSLCISRRDSLAICFNCRNWLRWSGSSIREETLAPECVLWRFLNLVIWK